MSITVHNLIPNIKADHAATLVAEWWIKNDKWEEIALKAKDAGNIAIVDHEPFPTNESEFEEWSDTIVDGIARMREAAGHSLRIGCYGVPFSRSILSTHHLSRAEEGENWYAERIEEWKDSKIGHEAFAKRIKTNRGSDGRMGHDGVSDAIDVMCPSLYVPVMTNGRVLEPKWWIKEYMRLCQSFQKPLLPYIWTRYGSPDYQNPMTVDHAQQLSDGMLAMGQKDVILWWPSNKNNEWPWTDEDAAVAEVFVNAFGS